MIITDPKSELYALTAARLSQKGFYVQAIDFGNIQHSMRYNPLSRVNTQLEIKQFATSLYDMSNKGTSSEGIWRQGAIRLLETIIRSLKNYPDPRYHTMANLIHIFNHIEDGTDTIKTFVERYAPNQDTRDRFNSFLKAEVKIRLGQHGSSITCLNPFDTDEIKILTAQDDIEFSLFRNHKTALFLKTPIGLGSQYTSILSLLYAQMFKHYLNTPITLDDEPILFLLEEFGVLKRLPAMEKTIALIRSKRVSINMVVQNIAQIDHVYGKEICDTIIANTASLIVLPGIKDDRTLTMVQNLLGKTTKETYSVSSGVRITPRPLMTKDEIRTLPKGEGLFFFGNDYGQKIRTLPLYKNYDLMERSGLISKHGALQALEPFSERFTATKEEIVSVDDIPLIPLKNLPDQETIDLEKKLEKLFNNRSTMDL